MRAARSLWLKPPCLTWEWLLPILLLTFWVGARGLYAAPLWGDEHNSITDAFGSWRAEPMRSPIEIWQEVAERNPWHAPGYFIFLNAWARLAGWSEFGLRASSLLVGVLAMAWTYQFGRAMFSSTVGVYAAAILGTSGLFIHYLYYLRPYALFVLLTPWTLWLYFRIIHSRREPSRLVWLGFLAVATVMLYVHYFAALPLAAIGVYHLLFVKKDARWWRVMGVLIAAGVLFLPWVGVILAGIGRAAGDEERSRFALSATQVIQEFIYVFGNGLPIFLGAALLLALTTRKRSVWRIALLTAVILAVLLIVNSQLQVILSERMRYLLELWPLLALLVAVGISRLRGLGLAALVVWMGIGLVSNSTASFEELMNISDYFYKFPWHRVAQPFRQVAQPEDVLILSMPDNVGGVAHRNQQVTTFYLLGSAIRSTVVESLTPGVPQGQRYAYAMKLMSTDPLRVWIGHTGQPEASDLSNMRAALRTSQYAACPVGLDLPAAQFELYTRSPICCVPEADAAPVMRFGDGIALTGVGPLPAEATGTLPVLIGWSVGETVPPNTYSVGLHMDNLDGEFVGQADYGLPNMRFSCRETQVPLDGLPPGDYRLYVVVYPWEGGSRLHGEIVETGEQGERLLLGTFSIA